MCEYVNLRNKLHHSVADYRYCCSPNEGTLQEEDHAAPASNSKLTCTIKTSLYVLPEATTKETVQVAGNSPLPVWPVLITID